MNVLSRMIIGCLLGLCAAPLMADEPEVICELGRSRIYLGESVMYKVTLNHVENPTPPELKGFDDFEVISAGIPKSINFQKLIFRNGQQTQIIRRGWVYDYQLTPRKLGTLVVPAPTIEVNGQTIHGQALTLSVQEPNSQDTVRMAITVDPPNVYPTQRMKVRLSIWIRALPDEFSRRNPVSIQRPPPALQIPWVNNSTFDEGLKPVEEAGAWLSQYRNLGGAGFSVNGLVDSSINSMFDSMFERQALTFEPPPQRVVLKDAKGNEADYWLYEFNRTYVAQRSGTYTFGPATLKGTFATNVGISGQLEGEQIFATAPPLEVTIKQVPEEGRPASYLGVVGRFDDWTAELKPTRCHVGDPITLTLTLRGTGSLASATPPDLSKIATIAQHFKTYEGTCEIKGNTCKFTYTLRPLTDTIKEFPPIPGSYFDVTTNQYVTTQTDPIPIDVEKAVALSDSQIVGGSDIARNPDELEVRRDGIFANVTDSRELRDQAVHPAYWAAGIVGLAVLYGLIALITQFIRHRMSDPSATRRRAAETRAKRRLHEATKLLRSGDTQQGAEQLRGALVGLVADVADVAEAGMTSPDACRRLRQCGVDELVVARLTQALEACDAMRYAGSGSGTDGLADEADQLFHSVVRSLKKQRHL